MRKFFAVAMALLFVVFAGQAYAGTANSNSTITINYAGSCSITANSLTIAYAELDTSGSFGVDVNCSNGLAWALTAGSGQNVSGELRRAKTGGNFMSYRFFKDAGLAQEVTVSANTVSTGNGNGAVQTSTVYTSVKAADNVAAAVGSYVDTVAFTVTF